MTGVIQDNCRVRRRDLLQMFQFAEYGRSSSSTSEQLTYILFDITTTLLIPKELCHFNCIIADRDRQRRNTSGGSVFIDSYHESVCRGYCWHAMLPLRIPTFMVAR